MKVADHETELIVVRTIIDTIVRQHYSHDRRNERLAAARVLLDHYMTVDYRGQNMAVELATLRTVYELCIWTLGYETHSAVKARLRLALDVIDSALMKVTSEGAKQRRSRHNVESSQDIVVDKGIAEELSRQKCIPLDTVLSELRSIMFAYNKTLSEAIVEFVKNDFEGAYAHLKVAYKDCYPEGSFVVVEKQDADDADEAKRRTEELQSLSRLTLIPFDSIVYTIRDYQLKQNVSFDDAVATFKESFVSGHYERTKGNDTGQN